LWIFYQILPHCFLGKISQKRAARKSYGLVAAKSTGLAIFDLSNLGAHSSQSP